MAHFAEIDANNIVVRVLVIPDEQENRGAEFLSVDLGLGGNWVQTSYNGNIRGRFAGIGDKYDAKNDVFIDVPNAEDIALQEAIEAKLAAREAALTKLKALGLTEEEANGLVP